MVAIVRLLSAGSIGPALDNRFGVATGRRRTVDRRQRPDYRRGSVFALVEHSFCRPPDASNISRLEGQARDGQHAGVDRRAPV
jgi:hypothetical protein